MHMCQPVGVDEFTPSERKRMAFSTWGSMNFHLLRGPGSLFVVMPGCRSADLPGSAAGVLPFLLFGKTRGMGGWMQILKS